MWKDVININSTPISWEKYRSLRFKYFTLSQYKVKIGLKNNQFSRDNFSSSKSINFIFFFKYIHECMFFIKSFNFLSYLTSTHNFLKCIEKLSTEKNELGNGIEMSVIFNTDCFELTFIFSMKNQRPHRGSKYRLFLVGFFFGSKIISHMLEKRVNIFPILRQSYSYNVQNSIFFLSQWL